MNYKSKTKDELINELIELQGAYNSLKLSYDKKLIINKQTKEKRTLSESDIQAMINNREESLWSIDNNYNVIICNDYFKNAYLTAYQIELKAGVNLVNILTPELKAFWKPKYDDALSGKKISFEFKETIQNKSFYFNVFLNPIYSNEQVAGVTALSVDITDRKNTEIELQKSEERNRKFLENNDAIILWVNPKNGKIIFANNAAVKFYGWKKEKLLAMTVNQINTLPPEEIKIKMMEAINNKQNYFVFKHHIANGTVRDVEVYQTKLYLKDEEIFSLIVHDITDRLQNEISIKLRESYLTSIIENQPGLVWLKDIDGRFLAVNSAFALSCGKKTPHGMLGKTDYDSWPKDIADKYRADDAKVIKQRKQLRIEEAVSEYNQTKWFETWKMPIFDEKDKPIGICGFSQEITNRKMHEELLRSSEFKFRTFVNYTNDWVYWAGQEDEFIYISPSCEKITGYKPEEFISDRSLLKKIVDVEDVRRCEAHIEKVHSIAGIHTSDSFDFKIIRKDGSKAHIHHLCNPIYDNKKYLGRGVSNRDISERKQMELEIHIKNEELEKINAEKDKFFSIIGHDLRSPFNSIIGFSDILIEQVREKDLGGIEEYAIIIQKSSQRAMDLLINLMEWSRSQTGRLKFSPEYFELVEYINKMILLLEAAAKQKAITIKKNLPRHTPIYADKDMINTVLRNLISNAIKFTPHGGEIMISTQGNENELTISVSDTGVGIPKDRIGKLFKLDENKSTSGTNNEKGTGLGLILCNEFVGKHHGRISVESTMGKGSTFSFTIPKQGEK